LAQAQLTTFWSFRLCTAMAFPKMRTFILDGLDVKDLLQKLKTSQVWPFLPPSHASPSNVWSTTIWHNMRQCKCQLYISILIQPSFIFCPSKPYLVDKGVLVANRLGWFQFRT
jgi:hypothetical protein